MTDVIYSPVLYKATNKPADTSLDDILAMFYQGTYGNTIGIMQALNTKTSEEELLLAGVSLDESGKPSYYPLAKILKAEDVTAYRAPDGNGGFIDPAAETYGDSEVAPPEGVAN